METIELRTTARCELLEITAEVERHLARTGVAHGAVVLQSMHTTAALTLNENADPDVRADLLAKLARLAPQHESFYRHAEGNSDAHLKTSFFSPSLTLIVHEGRLVLGQWQGIYLCEFDGPRTRRVALRILRAA